jgi:hypothetical protein
MKDVTTILLDVLLGLIIFFALLGVIITQTNTLGWSTLNVGGSIYNLNWVPFVLVLIIVLGIIVLVYANFKHKK